MSGIHFSGDVPEDVRAAFQQQIDQQEMMGEVRRQDIERLFDEMSVEHLTTLRMILGDLAVENSGRYSSYLGGIAATTLHLKYKVCGGCGKDHSLEINQPEPEPKPERPAAQEQLELPFAGAESVELASKALYDEYGVEPVPDEPGKVRCIECGTISQSLDDRMLRKPKVDGCEGCQQKAKWGTP